MADEVSFERDIAPLFKLYRAGMLWSMDLAKYEDVKAHAKPIFARIRSGNMPPPYPSLTPEQVELFATWMRQDFPA